MITKDILIIGGKNKIYLVNINQYRIIREIEQPFTKVHGYCMLNENIFLSGDSIGTIKQWKLEGDNLILVSAKDNAHDESIYILFKIGDGHIASSSLDASITIW